MATLVNMAEKYGCRPSSLLGLADYAAYCFDEAAFYLLAKVPRSKDGAPQWGNLRWGGEKKQGNREFIAFVQGQKGR